MAAELTVDEVTRTNRVPSIVGTGFQVSSPVAVSIAEAGLIATVDSDLNGDFDLSTVLTWQPLKEGKYTITADDGTDQLTSTIQVYSTT